MLQNGTNPRLLTQLGHGASAQCETCWRGITSANLGVGDDQCAIIRTLVTILPCNDLDASERFYNRLGFVRRAEAGDPDYRILSNRAGGHLHLTGRERLPRPRTK